jgi:hypothetical protein
MEHIIVVDTIASASRSLDGPFLLHTIIRITAERTPSPHRPTRRAIGEWGS